MTEARRTCGYEQGTRERYRVDLVCGRVLAWLGRCRQMAAAPSRPMLASPVANNHAVGQSERTSRRDLYHQRYYGRCSGGRSQTLTCSGCIVSWTTETRSTRIFSRSTSSRRVAPKLASVWLASYLRR